jgi:hypothetical protein
MSLKNRELRLAYCKKYREEHKAELATKAKKRREEHPEIFKERHRRYGGENKEKINANQRKRYKETKFGLKKYGMTKKEYDEMNLKQKGKCALCGKDNIKKRKIVALGVDHNHKTGKIRGLLCNNCNVMLGMITDDTNLLLKIQEYLLKNKSKE